MKNTRNKENPHKREISLFANQEKKIHSINYLYLPFKKSLLVHIKAKQYNKNLILFYYIHKVY